MEITHVTLKDCTQALKDAEWKFARAGIPRLAGAVLELTTASGVTGYGYLHAIPSITANGASAQASMRWLQPMLIGERIDAVSALMDDLDRKMAFNISVKAAVDMAVHDALGRALGVPVHVLLGGARRDRIPQSRLLALKAPLDMARQAAALAAEGYRQLKLKLSGEPDLDVDRVAEVRSAVGASVALTLDPNQAYDSKQMMRAFARMERHEILLIEQPVPAADWRGLAALTRALPVAIEADESAQTVQDVRRLVSEGVVDAVNLKLTKLGGFRRLLEAAALCEAGGVTCRLGAAFGPALLQAAAAQAASVLRQMPYACELSEHQHLMDDPFEPLPVEDGMIAVPQAPGCGVSYAMTAEAAHPVVRT